MNNVWVWIGIVILIVLVTAANRVLDRLLAARDRSDAGHAPLPYRRKDYLLSKAERSFYEVLRQALGDGSEVIVFAKVRLLDLLLLEKGTTKPQSHRNRVISKHVDFVLCDRKYLRPLLVIELDDKSHDEGDRRDRDAFVDRALTAAGLPVLHLTARRTYSTRELADQVRSAIAANAGARVSP